MKLKKFFARNGILITSLTIAAAIFYASIAGLLPIGIVSTGSMAPNLPVGTLVVMAPADNLKVTDIIAFRNPNAGGQITTHTFIGYDTSGNLMTKGDANPTPDNFDRPLTKADVTGKVIIKVVPLWSNPIGIMIMILFLLGGAIMFMATRIKDDVLIGTVQEESPQTVPVNL